MRIEPRPNGLRLVLSERNLRALLAKLAMPDSACTLYKTSDDGMLAVFVSSEPDDQHYGDRTPGPMHPLTEIVISKG